MAQPGLRSKHDEEIMTRALKTAIVLMTAIGAVIGAILFSQNGPHNLRHDSPGDELRIVSVAPSVTEVLFTLGMGDCLIGVTDHCDYPPEAKRIEQVGGFGAPNVEKLLEMSPDLMIAAGLERPEIADLLRESGIRVLDVRIRTIEELFEATYKIGDAVNRSQAADEAVARMRAELQIVAKQYGSAGPERRPKVFVEIWENPLTTVGGVSYLDDLITRVGGVNVAHEIPQAYPHINPEKVIQWNPDFILVAHMNAGETGSQFARRIGWADISAVRGGRIIDDIDPDLLLRPGPRLVHGAKTLALRLHKAPVENQQR